MDETQLLLIFVVISFAGFTFYERRGIRNFDPRIFEFGFPFLKFKEASRFSFCPAGVEETASGSFKIISSQTLLFQTNDALFSLRLRTMFPLKGKIELSHGEATITGKPPLSGVLFILFWLIWWHAAGVAVILNSERVWQHGAMVIAVGWITAGLLVGVSFYLEKRRFMKVLSEIKNTASVGGR